MRGTFPEIVLVRHGETAWSLSGQHTGRTDIPLTPAGEAASRQLAARFHGRSFAAVWTSPSLRARTTCRLAGFGPNSSAGNSDQVFDPGFGGGTALTAAASPRSNPVPEVKPDLAEWDYGDHEGRTTKEILAQHPDWQLFHHGSPGGEAVAEVGARADRVIAEIRALDDDLIIFSSSHFLRVLAARWLGLPVAGGRLLILGTASVSVLGYDHDRTEPVLRAWNT